MIAWPAVTGTPVRTQYLAVGEDMDRLLLLIPTTSYRVGDFLEVAHRLDVAVAVGSNRRQVLEKYADGATVTLDFANVETGVEQILAYADTYPLKAIVATDEETTDKGVCEELGISTRQLSRWRDELRLYGDDAFPGQGRNRDEEFTQLKRENAKLRRERDFLRDAAVFFAKESK